MKLVENKLILINFKLRNVLIKVEMLSLESHNENGASSRFMSIDCKYLFIRKFSVEVEAFIRLLNICNEYFRDCSFDTFGQLSS